MHDDFVKSPSVPLGAGLRGNFVAAAHPLVRLTPQFLRALHLELFTKPSFPWFFFAIIRINGSAMGLLASLALPA